MSSRAIAAATLPFSVAGSARNGGMVIGAALAAKSPIGGGQWSWRLPLLGALESGRILRPSVLRAYLQLGAIASAFATAVATAAATATASQTLPPRPRRPAAAAASAS